LLGAGLRASALLSGKAEILNLFFGGNPAIDDGYQEGSLDRGGWMKLPTQVCHARLWKFGDKAHVEYGFGVRKVSDGLQLRLEERFGSKEKGWR